MKLNIISGLFLALVATVSAATPGATTCLIRHPGIYTAIQDFCNKGNIMVPSKYALSGKKHGGMYINISGNCKPKQWVPRKWCTKHFMRLCARSNDQGANRRKLGRNHCQTWLTWPMG
ncbi:hypothetical protein LTR37_008230 [Vermiconidia calcicola]|uniref:Uncharacterized protein n=1 Tax=Vermiconidia calcicola TaxID=1690605 RepID=A0ACC3NB02_9PEZI|nr:hypothetical protein LTR37_008230 [Vermiconidia calcicola]